MQFKEIYYQSTYYRIVDIEQFNKLTKKILSQQSYD